MTEYTTCTECTLKVIDMQGLKKYMEDLTGEEIKPVFVDAAIERYFGFDQFVIEKDGSIEFEIDQTADNEYDADVWPSLAPFLEGYITWTCIDDWDSDTWRNVFSGGKMQTIKPVTAWENAPSSDPYTIVRDGKSITLTEEELSAIRRQDKIENARDYLKQYGIPSDSFDEEFLEELENAIEDAIAGQDLVQQVIEGKIEKRKGE